ncbi:hypothetical protein SUGI_0414650 [Cryptomeria japonica]|uniref:uncharacterized protein LOC131875204 n=1 Tax=Cryptomeria japonica TaxID=3369 RepID=UPI0024089FD8|nr:uncharacterized protein LOC131875204 [Cryptomeria japonica]GLJ22103.1 hypothetical protein SUGI_0414650 [Cryptomeria japonica]
MKSWALTENEVPSPFYEDGFSFMSSFVKSPQKQQPSNSRKRSSKRRKRKNKGRVSLEHYNRGYYEYGLGPGPSVSECLSSRQRNYKQKYEQKLYDLGLLEVEFNHVLQERKRISNEKLRTDEMLQETNKILEIRTNKCNQLEQVQKEFGNLKVALGCVIEDNGRVLKENDKLSDQLKQADEKVAHYMQQSDQLKCELDLAAQDKMAVSEELMKTKNLLKQKEIVEELSGKDEKVSDCLICMESCVATGDHNTCSLACGHFFGRSCIEKWIKETGAKISKCPVCQRKAILGDIRNHYT